MLKRIDVWLRGGVRLTKMLVTFFLTLHWLAAVWNVLGLPYGMDGIDSSDGIDGTDGTDGFGADDAAAAAGGGGGGNGGAGGDCSGDRSPEVSRRLDRQFLFEYARALEQVELSPRP